MSSSGRRGHSALPLRDEDNVTTGEDGASVRVPVFCVTSCSHFFFLLWLLQGRQKGKPHLTQDLKRNEWHHGKRAI